MSQDAKLTLGATLALAVALIMLVKGLVSGRMPSGPGTYDRKKDPVSFHVWLLIYLVGAAYMLWVIVQHGFRWWNLR